MTHPIDSDPELAKEHRAFVLLEDDVAQWLVVIRSNYYWCDFAAYRAFDQGANEPLTFRHQDWRKSGDERPWSNHSTSIVQGYVKWDGCTKFKAAAHFCDAADSYQELSDVLQETMAAAHALMSEKSGGGIGPDWDKPPAERLQRFASRAIELLDEWVPSHQRNTATA